MSVLPHRFSLFKRSNDVYYIVYTQNGRQKWNSTGATTKPEALKVLTKFKELFQEQLRSVSLEQFVSQFFAFAESNLSQNSVRLYRTVFKTFVPFVRSAYVNEVNAETIDRYKTKRLKEISPVSVNVELRMLKAAFSTARRWKLTEQNAFDEVSFAKVPEQAPLALAVEDFQKLISCIREGWFRELVTFAVLTGLRRGEILNLRWSDVDLPKKLIHIQSNIQAVRSEGEPQQSVFPVPFATAYLCDVARAGWRFTLRGSEASWTFFERGDTDLQPFAASTHAQNGQPD